jgi:hypothetical protein
MPEEQIELIRVVINDAGTEFDSSAIELTDSGHLQIFSFVNSRYSKYAKEINESGGYVYVDTDNDGRTLSYQIKSIPTELIERINSFR